VSSQCSAVKLTVWSNAGTLPPFPVVFQQGGQCYCHTHCDEIYCRSLVYTHTHRHTYVHSEHKNIPPHPFFRPRE